MTLGVEASSGYTLEAQGEKVGSEYELTPDDTIFGIRDPKGMLMTFSFQAYATDKGGWIGNEDQMLQPGESVEIGGATFTGK